MHNKNKLKRSSVLVAKDRCMMALDNRPTLTIGKKYRVKELYDDTLMVVDDDKTNHLFSVERDSNSYFRKYFRLQHRKERHAR